MLLKTIKYAFWAGLFGVAISGGVIAGAYYSTLDELPDVAELKQVSFETPMKIFTQDGKLIGEFGEHKRIPVDIKDIPLKMQQAFLAIEDSRFYEHSGIDPIGILRAVVVAVTKGGASQGASTITQQVARNFFLTRDRTIERKVKEIFIAWRIEQILSKDEILELYLNKIALGHRSYGVVAAAQTYYGKSLKELTLAEMATIAGLPKAPSTLNPITSPERAKDRRHLVLQRMLTLGYITEAEFNEADVAPSKAEYHSTPLDAYAPFVAEEARQFAIKELGEEAYIKGVKVYTTVDSKYQDYAHQAIFDNLTEYDTRHGYRGPLLNIYDTTRGIKGSAKKPTEKNGANANANNGLIMEARNSLLAEFAQNRQKISYRDIVAKINDEEVLLNAQNAANGPIVTKSYASVTYDEMLASLKKEDKYNNVRPALVLNVDDSKKQATLLTTEGEQAVLSWEGMSWAKPFKTDRNQGEAPTYPSEFLVKGDLVFTYLKNIEIKSKRRNAPVETYELLTLTQLPDVEGALIALDPYTGAIRAMSGGYDFEKSKFNRTTQLLRQSGSNFKPFIYSAAVAYGLAPNSVMPDEPIKTWDPGSRTWWEPRNSPNRFDGLMTLREGLARSKNSISIRTIRQVGVANVVEHLKKFDINVPSFQQSESMALGSMELTPLHVATAYASFANGGYKLSPYLIDRIELEDGTVLYQSNPQVANRNAPDMLENGIALKYKKNVSQIMEEYPNLPPQILTHAHAYIVSSLMQSVIYGGHGLNDKYWGTGGRAAAITGRDDLSGKTGTTNNVHDAWFSGFNANLVVTSWVGFDNDRDLGYTRGRGSESGSATALPIFAQFFKDAQANVPSSPIPRPAGIIAITNREITDIALPGMRIIDDGSSASGVKNTGIDSSTVTDEGDIF